MARWSIAAWVRLPTILWVEEITRSAPLEIASGGSSGWKRRCAPQASSTTSGSVPGVGHLGEARDVGAGAEVGGGDRDRRDRARRRGRAPPSSASGVMQCATPSSGSSSGETKAGRRPERMRPSITEEWTFRWITTSRPGVGQGEAHRLVSLGGPVDQEPGSPRSPGAGGEALRLLERGRLGPHVDPLDQRRDVVEQGSFPGQGPQRRVGAGPALVPGYVQSPGVAARVGEDRVDVGGRVGPRASRPSLCWRDERPTLVAPHGRPPGAPRAPRRAACPAPRPRHQRAGPGRRSSTCSIRRAGSPAPRRERPFQFPGMPGNHWYVVERVGYPGPRDLRGELRGARRVADRGRRMGRDRRRADRDRRLLAGHGDVLRRSASEAAVRGPPGSSPSRGSSPRSTAGSPTSPHAPGCRC